MPGTPRLIPHLCGWWLQKPEPTEHKAVWGSKRALVTLLLPAALASHTSILFTDTLDKHQSIITAWCSSSCSLSGRYLCTFFVLFSALFSTVSIWSGFSSLWNEAWVYLCFVVHILGDAGKFRVVVLCWVVTQTGFVSSGGTAGRASRRAHGLECQEWGGWLQHGLYGFSLFWTSLTALFEQFLVRKESDWDSWDAWKTCAWRWMVCRGSYTVVAVVTNQARRDFMIFFFYFSNHSCLGKNKKMY